MYFRSQKKSSQDVSLSDYIDSGSDGANLSIMDVVRDEEDLTETICKKDAIQRVNKAIKRCLSDQERQIISLRYGLNGTAPLRQREVAVKTGISRSYVSRIEKRALQKLRAEMDAE